MAKMPVLALVILVGAVLAAGQGLSNQPTIPVPNADARHTVAAFVAQNLFMDEEFEPAVNVLGRAGIRVVIVSAETLAAASMNGLFVKPAVALRDLSPADYGGILLFSGAGAALHWKDSLLHSRLRQFDSAGRVVAAIGTMPIALAEAGLLKGRRATVFLDREAIRLLESGGARHSFNGIVTDRNIITAADQRNASGFGRLVARELERR